MVEEKVVSGEVNADKYDGAGAGDSGECMKHIDDFGSYL